MRCFAQFDLSGQHAALVARAEALVPSFAARAARYDAENIPQKEDFDDLRKAGLLPATVLEKFGGLGLGYTDSRDPLPLWLITKTLARADLALARNWENHVNMVETLCVIGNEEQQEGVRQNLARGQAGPQDLVPLNDLVDAALEQIWVDRTAL